MQICGSASCLHAEIESEAKASTSKAAVRSVINAFDVNVKVLRFKGVLCHEVSVLIYEHAFIVHFDSVVARHIIIRGLHHSPADKLIKIVCASEIEQSDLIAVISIDEIIVIAYSAVAAGAALYHKFALT